LADLELRKGLGESYEYSNLGAGLLGHLLAKQAGKPYERLVIEAICAPLAMADTGIVLNRLQQQRLATPHLPGLQKGVNWQFDALAGAGALRSTVHDMLRFARAHLEPDHESGLGRAMASTMQPHRDTGMPNTRVGLAWHLMEARDLGVRVVGHDGRTGSYTSFLALVPERRCAVVILCNTSCDSLQQLGRRLLAVVLAENSGGKRGR
jgi:CubicO group peptidase (beta-lactamase class C family)